MKRIFSLALAGVMVFSALPMAYAADVDYQNGTEVEYTGSRTTVNADGTETHNAEYTITVPALLAPGGSGTVTLQGMWPSDATVKVTAEDKVEMVNNINSADKKTLAVTFTAIELAGNNTAAVSDDETVSVADISNALFGTWSGKFNYNVEYNGEAGGSGTVTPPTDPEEGDTTLVPGDGEFILTIAETQYLSKMGMSWADWVNSEYNTDGYIIAKVNYNEQTRNGVVNANKDKIVLLSTGMVEAHGTPTSTHTYTLYDLGTIWKLAEEANLITFTIRDTEYQAEEGMTWGEWLNSEYNTSDTFVSAASNKISDGKSWYVTKMDGTYIYTDDAIEANVSYTTGL